MMICPKLAKMQKMFQWKNASSSKGKTIVKVKTVIIDVNVINFNVVTRSIITKYQLFQEREPQKNKSTTYWKKEEKLKKIMVETIQKLQKAQTTSEGSSTSIEGWNTMWPSMPNITLSI
jgi:hypothetical protein